MISQDYSDDLQILIYDAQKSNISKVIRNLGFYNFHRVKFVTDLNEAIEACRIISPDVVITDHREAEQLCAGPFLHSLRKFSDTPVVTWGSKLDSETENRLLSYKNSYILHSTDGFFNLIDIIRRIGMKARNPGLWG